MRNAYRVAEVRAAEELLMATNPEPDLMQIAATGLARVTAELMPTGMAGTKVTALIGSGNNGGDVLFACAELARRNCAVTAVLLSDSCHPAGMAALRRAGGTLMASTDPAAIATVRAATVVVDGIVGIGASGPLRSPAHELVAAIDDSIVVAADIPSGVDPNTGSIPDPRRVVRADVTVTFGCLKPGLVLQPGRDVAGTVEVIDIGLDQAMIDQAVDCSMVDPMDVQPRFAEPGIEDYKYSHGVLGVAAGSAQYPGAAHMVVGAARHCGIGMVRLHAEPGQREAADAVVVRFPDVVVTEAAPKKDGRATGWTVGPGLGTDESAARVLESALRSDLPVVVDADGLTLLADHDELRSLVRSRRAPSVLTPHVGEFARLGFELGLDRIAATKIAAVESGAVIVLKGSSTVISDESGRVFVDMMGSPALATAGTGDALSGIVGAAICRAGEKASVETVAAAVYLHGLSGRIAGRGQRPVTAWDVVTAVPEAVAEIRR